MPHIYTTEIASPWYKTPKLLWRNYRSLKSYPFFKGYSRRAFSVAISYTLEKKVVWEFIGPVWTKEADNVEFSP